MQVIELMAEAVEKMQEDITTVSPEQIAILHPLVYIAEIDVNDIAVLGVGRDECFHPPFDEQWIQYDVAGIYYALPVLSYVFRFAEDLDIDDVKDVYSMFGADSPIMDAYFANDKIQEFRKKELELWIKLN